MCVCVQLPSVNLDTCASIYIYFPIFPNFQELPGHSFLSQVEAAMHSSCVGEPGAASRIPHRCPALKRRLSMTLITWPYDLVVTWCNIYITLWFMMLWSTSDQPYSTSMSSAWLGGPEWPWNGPEPRSCIMTQRKRSRAIWAFDSRREPLRHRSCKREAGCRQLHFSAWLIWLDVLDALILEWILWIIETREWASCSIW